jgi:nucleoside-diphosphate-sugar epimerase
MSARPPIVVTGPTGWIGTALLAAIARRRGPGWQREVRLFATTGRDHTAPDGSVLPIRALSSLTGTDTRGALVVHLAYLTKEKVESLGEQAFFATNSAIDQALAAALEDGPAAGLFVASSGAAALAAAGTDYHLYGVSKLLQEQRFLRLAERLDMPMIAGRIFNIAGPYINKIDSYAISAFIAQALRTGSIAIGATTPVFRSYLHVDDLCALVLGALEAGIGRFAATDLSGAEVLEMSDIAVAVAAATGLGRAAIHRAAVDHGRPSVYLGDSTHTRTLAMELGLDLAGFPQQVADTLAYLRGQADLPPV